MKNKPFFFPFSRVVYCILFSLIIWSSCKTDTNDPSASTTVDAPVQKRFVVPSFEADTAYQYIEKQVSFGPRVPNSEAHQACKNWLIETFKRHDAAVIPQNFTATAYNKTRLNGTNIIAQYNTKAKKRILLAAHWDSRHLADSPINDERTREPIVAADDGGSGVGILLEIARHLSEKSPEKLGVDLILFDAEDYGDDNRQSANMESWCLGSRYWARNPHIQGYSAKYGILLDMVGAEGATFPRERKSVRYAPHLVEMVWKIGQAKGYGNFFVDRSAEVGIDDHVPVNKYAKIPMIDIINMNGETATGFGTHWHTHDDNLDIISRRTLKAVGQTMLEIIYREDAGKI